MLKVAIPNQITYTDKQLQFLLANIGVDSALQDDYKAVVSNKFPVEIRKMSYREIFRALTNGTQDIGIVLHLAPMEAPMKVCCLHSFCTHKVNLSLFIPKDMHYKNLESLTGKRIATPYPSVLAPYLKAKNLKATVVPLENITCAFEFGIADAICIISGNKQYKFTSQLREIETVTQTYPIIISGENLQAQKQMILDELIERIISAENAQNKKLICISFPNDKKEAIIEALAQFEGPVSVTPALREQTIIRCFLDEKQFWDIKSHLKMVGAETIFVLPVENIIK
ncbi:MAG: hypothetical protein LBS50_08900 [Prevotellaceae bacterium]|jgi:ATP phosphoribosyltransferase|nr:hypothetical protein [Prevotellaceae bacterium]